MTALPATITHDSESIDVDYLDNTDDIMANNHSRNNNHYVSSLADEDYLMMMMSAAESQRIETVAKPEQRQTTTTSATSYSPQGLDIKSIFGNYKSPELTIDPFKLYEDASQANDKNNGAAERSKYSQIVSQIFDDRDGVDRVIVERRPLAISPSPSPSPPPASSSSVKGMYVFTIHN
ncbi:hypothetical protein BLA29_002403 [Euroglyphus maynei]|uniref:Uncharacterized protein n=1 Tax=Euroglyphus maynei TaxID=6958 RepID=A0A1Y3BJ51_EURMA|nr:hypothetical protein BLA29_002403 [Euroglyphus maynei]